MHMNARMGSFFLMFLLLVCIGLMSFLYLVKFTEIHTKGYQLRRIEIEKDSLIASRQIRSTDIARSKSLQHIRERAMEMNMIPATHIVYFQPDAAIAQARNPLALQ